MGRRQAGASHSRSGVQNRNSLRRRSTGTRSRGPVLMEPLEGRLLLSAGSLDATFGVDGKVIAPYIGSTVDNAKAVAVQSDGKVIMAGATRSSLSQDFLVMRLNLDGTLDGSFGAGGCVITDLDGRSDAASAVAVQADGKIVVAGTTVVANSSNSDFAVVRYTSDGVLDPTFDGDGIAITDIEVSRDTANALVIQPDGKILVGGSQWLGNNFSMAMVRYNADGSLDNTFGYGGKQVRDLIPGGPEDIRGMALQADGKIVIVGTNDAGPANMIVARFTSWGWQDQTFAPGGYRLFSSGGTGDAFGESVAIQPDGKILAGGTCAGQGRIIRLNTDGTSDTSFYGGSYLIPDAYSVSGMAIQPDGRIVLTGRRYVPLTNYDFFAMRLNRNGGVDTTFTGNGYASIDLGSGVDMSVAVALQADGRVIVVGNTTSTFAQGGENFGIVRLQSNGALDTSFSQDGKASFDSIPRDMEDSACSTLVLANGKIMTAGLVSSSSTTSFYCLALTRHNADGTLDITFGAGGRRVLDGMNVLSPLAGPSVVMAAQPDGKIVLVYQDSWSVKLARINADGSLDTTFGSGGIVSQGSHGFTDTTVALAIRPDGKIFVGGSNQGQAGLVCYNSNGTRDTSFQMGWQSSRSIASLVPQPDGKILAVTYGSAISPRFQIIRLMPTGALDLSFGTGGAVSTLFRDTGYRIGDQGFDLTIQPDGKIVAVGASIGYTTDSAFAVARYTANGLWDTTFSDDGRAIVKLSAGLDVANNVLIEANGNIIVAGTASGDFAMIRLTPDGNLDPAFGVKGVTITDFGSADDQLMGLAMQPDGRLVAVGSTKSARGDLDSVLARYDGTASIAARAGGSYGMLEGGSVTLVGSAVATMPISLYEWDLDYDGQTFTPDVTGPTATLSGLDGPATRIVALRATDSQGLSDIDTATVVVNNIAPTLTVSDGGAIIAGQTFQLQFSASDPGNDRLDHWTINWGDGRIDTLPGDATGASHVYADSGLFNIIVSAADEDGTYEAITFGKKVASGVPDAGFGAGGQAIADFLGKDEGRAVIVQPDGKTIVGGSSLTSGVGNFALIRYNLDGTVDHGFGLNGQVITEFGNDDHITGLALQPDGRIVAVGTTWSSVSHDFAAARYTSDGALDSSFGVGGKTIVHVGYVTNGANAGSDDLAPSVILQPDGRIVLVGTSKYGVYSTPALIRLDASGGLDPTYGINGVASPVMGGSVSALAAAIQPDGKIVVGGTYDLASNGTFALARFNSDGSLDLSFDQDGKVTTTFVSYHSARITGLAIQPDGKIVAAGDCGDQYSPMDMIVARYNPNGSLDTGFGAAGTLIVGQANQAYDSSQAMVLQPNGKIMVAGYVYTSSSSTYDTLLLQVNSDGTPDTTFDGDGRMTVDVGMADKALGMALSPDGRIVVVGSRNFDSTGSDMFVLRYHASLPVAAVSSVISSATLTNNGPVSEGSPASVSFAPILDPVTGDPVPGLRYSYDFNNDGTFEITDSASPTAAVPANLVADGPANQIVRARVIDQTGLYSDRFTTLIILNAAPQVVLSCASTVEAGRPLAVNVQLTEPGMDTWVGSVNWGDGTGVHSMGLNGDKTFTLAQTYITPGQYVVTVTIIDSDGAVGQAQINVTVQTPWINDIGPVNEGSPAWVSFAPILDPVTGDPVPGLRYSFDFNNDGIFEISNSTSPTADVPASLVADGPASRAIHGRVTDQTGAYSDHTTTLTVLNVAPQVILPPTATIKAGGALVISGRFTDPGVDTWSATVNWDDGTGDHPLTLNADKTFLLNHTYTTAWLHTVKVTVTESDGTVGSAVSYVTVQSPALANSGPVYEGSPASVSFDPSYDPTPGDPITGLRYSFDFNNDGTFEIVNSTSYTAAVPASLVADGPASLTIRGRVTDHTGLYVDSTTILTVLNAAPQVTLASAATITTGKALAISGQFTDLGVDTWSATVNWGDGTNTRTLTLNADKTFLLDRAYVAPGQYAVTVTVTDSDGAVGSAVINVTVQLPELKVEQIVIGDGSAQRSMIKQMTVVFSTPASMSTDGIELIDCQTNQAIPIIVGNFSQDGRTWGVLYGGGGSHLPEGRYDLVVHGDRFHSVPDGQAMVGDQHLAFHCLSGDVTGDGVVDVGDLGVLGANYGRQQAGIPGDMNGDNAVDVSDLGILGANYGRSLPALGAAAGPLAGAIDESAIGTSAVAARQAPMTATRVLPNSDERAMTDVTPLAAEPAEVGQWDPAAWADEDLADWSPTRVLLALASTLDQDATLMVDALLLPVLEAPLALVL